MELLLAALAFLIVATILVASFALAGGGKMDNVVRNRLESLERSTRRKSPSLELQLVRDELLSEVPALHKLLSQWRWSTRLRAYLAQAGLKIKPGKLILASAVLALLGLIAADHLYHLPLVSMAAAVLVGLVPFAYVYVQRGRRLRAFEGNFAEAIDLLGRSVRAGHSFATGLEMIGTELAEPVAGEFRIVFEEHNFGLPLKDAFLNLCERVPLIDVRFFVTALLIQRETGGNLAEILDKLSAVIRERFRIKGQVRTHTAQGRLTAAILIALPPGMTLMLWFLNPNYMSLLWTDPVGPYMIGVAAVMQVIGALLLWKIVNIEV
jgi:tight adherence protein B